tara:strand:+ start:1807 stop:4101 length:2295 start_codon:yes stop_codon:yes gene_type:complete
MLSNQKLFSIGNFDFRLQHLLVLGILILSVSTSMLIRSSPASYGFELFEFDPFYNYRATEFIIENGITEYFEWVDEKTWHPYSRNVSETSQVTLHLSAASLYPIFNFGATLYDFTILFPLVIGSLTTIVVFAFVRVLAGTTAGLFAALIFSVSVPIITRGLIGWFKSEPLGLFFGILAIYLFTSGIKFNKGKISFIKLIIAGFLLSLGLSAWGGILFFIIPIALFYLFLPFVKNEKNFLIWAAPTFSISLIVFSLLFERTSSFIIGYAGLTILLPTIFVVVSEIIKKFSSESTKIRNCILFLASIIIGGIGLISSNIVGLPSFRYLNAVNPFLTNEDFLTDSVSEHLTTSLNLSFTFLSVFIIFAVIGIWVLFSKNNHSFKIDMRIFALVVSFIAIYVSSSFVRLELFASIAMIILGSIGLKILLEKTFQQNKTRIIKFILPSVILILFITPLVYPENYSWVGWADFTPTILNGGSQYTQFVSNDWFEAMNWLKNNTSNDAVIASWWDYGYWISSLSERTTLIDNATLIDWQINKMAFALITSPENSWHILSSHYTEDISNYIGNETIIAFGGTPENEFIENYRAQNNGKDCEMLFISEKIINPSSGLYKRESCNPITKGMDADYILVYIIGERFYVENSTVPLYTLEGGGDESKKTWFAKISNHQVSRFIQDDNITPTDYFMNKSTLGNLMPFSIVKYVEPNTGRTFDQYQNGLIPVYVNDFKFADPENDPYILVYASPSFYNKQPGIMSAVLIYKINPDYQS